MLGGPRAEARYAGMDMGDSQVGGGPRAVVGVMAGLGASGWGDRGRSRYRGQGGGYRSGESGGKKLNNNKR